MTFPAYTKSRLLFCFVVLVTMGTASLSNAAEKAGLEELIEIALQQNKEILAAKSRIAESTEMIRQSGTLPDPELGLEYFLQPVETRTGPQEASISLKQSIPWLGRLSLDRQLKQHEADIAQAFYYQTRFNVIRQVKEAYIEYGYLGQAKKITGQILELMNYLEGIAHTNYSSGKTSYADVLKIQIETDKLHNRQLSFEDNYTPVRVRINNILGVDKNMARPVPEALPNVSLSRHDDEIFSLFQENNPSILAGHYKVTRNRTRLDIADQAFYPDLMVNVKTILTGEAEFGDPPDSGRNPVIAGLSLTLPLFFDRRNGAIAEKQASVRTARNELDQMTKSLDDQIELILFRYREADRMLTLYSESLIPKVRQEMDVALESFQGGQYSILELIDAEKNWLNFELAKIKAQADKAIQIARLEELTGTTLANWKQGI